jgi:hypothetical protein
MKRRLVVLLAVAGIGFGASGTAPQVIAVQPALASHCNGGYVSAYLPWGHKCLRSGQYCKLSGDRYYHRYGFHCHRASRDRNGNYHLTR